MNPKTVLLWGFHSASVISGLELVFNSNTALPGRLAQLNA
jgi:hypothetical protein